MPWKSITTFVADIARDGVSLDAAVTLARRSGGHLDVVCLGVDPTQPEAIYAGAQVISLPGSLAEAERESDMLAAEATARLNRADIRWSVSRVATPLVGVNATVANEARFADLVVTAQPYRTDSNPTDVALVEAALFSAGVPVLVVPAAGLPQRFDNIVVAWNDSDEALHAIRLCLDLLVAARSVEIVLVDPPRHGSERSDPGGRLAQMLARHGVTASVRILALTMPSVGEQLARHVTDSGADLLLMGAYGHSRLRESILGGATREMLETSPVPVLLAR